MSLTWREWLRPCGSSWNTFQKRRMATKRIASFAGKNKKFKRYLLEMKAWLLYRKRSVEKC
jgi:hypothetical protein